MGKSKMNKIDKDKFEKMLTIQCTEEEIASVFDTNIETLNQWVKKNYFDEEGNPLTFQKTKARFKNKGKVRMRAVLWELAAKGQNTALKIALKYYLGLSEDSEEKQEKIYIVSGVLKETEEEKCSD